MCVVSKVMDHYRDKWYLMIPPSPVIYENVNPVTDEEILEFRTLLERARKYDKEHNEPNCELEEKKDALKKIAKILNIDISFVDKPDEQSSS